MRRGGAWAIVAIAVVIAARVTGIVTLGVVASGSMEPTLPAGSLFVAVRGDADVGDVVVYTAPDGARVVHRVVDRTPDGLLTRGDANARTDQDDGLPPVDPRRVNVVPAVGEMPIALRGPWLKPAALLGVQVALLAVGLRGLAAERARGRARRDVLDRVRPHHLYALAAVVMLASSPLLHETVEARGSVGISAGPLPTLVLVESASGREWYEIPALGTAVIEGEGTLEVTRAPHVPGARLLAPYGATLATVPMAIVLLAAALAFRAAGW